MQYKQDGTDTGTIQPVKAHHEIVKKRKRFELKTSSIWCRPLVQLYFFGHAEMFVIQYGCSTFRHGGWHSRYQPPGASMGFTVNKSIDVLYLPYLPALHHCWGIIALDGTASNELP